MSDPIARCPSCGTKFEIEEGWIGLQGSCPVCGKEFPIQPEAASPAGAVILKPVPAQPVQVKLVAPVPTPPTVAVTPVLVPVQPSVEVTPVSVPAAPTVAVTPVSAPATPTPPPVAPMPIPAQPAVQAKQLPSQEDIAKKLKGSSEKIARIWQKCRKVVIAAAIVLIVGGLVALGIVKWREYTAKKAEEERLRQEEIARKAKEEKIRQEKAARKAEEERLRQERAARKAQREKRRREEAERREEERRLWREKRTRVWQEYLTAVRQKQPDRVFVWSARAPDARMMIFRYDKELVPMLTRFLEARNRLRQYNASVSAAVAAYRDRDPEAVMEIYRNAPLLQGSGSAGLPAEITAHAKRVIELAKRKDLLVRQAGLADDGRLVGELPEGKYIIVRLSMYASSIGYIFYKPQDRPIFLEAAEEKWIGPGSGASRTAEPGSGDPDESIVNKI